MPRLVEPRLRRGATGAWKTLRVSHPAHSPDDEHGDISIELTEGTFLKSFDRPSLGAPASWRAQHGAKPLQRLLFRSPERCGACQAEWLVTFSRKGCGLLSCTPARCELHMRQDGGTFGVVVGAVGTAEREELSQKRAKEPEEEAPPTGS